MAVSIHSNHSSTHFWQARSDYLNHHNNSRRSGTFGSERESQGIFDISGTYCWRGWNDCLVSYQRVILTCSKLTSQSSAFVCRKWYDLWTCIARLLWEDHNSLLIYGSLKKPTLDRFAIVTHFSTFASMLACLAMALAGFLTFGDKTQGNILNNFPKDNVMVNVARVLVAHRLLAKVPHW